MSCTYCCTDYSRHVAWVSSASDSVYWHRSDQKWIRVRSDFKRTHKQQTALEIPL